MCELHKTDIELAGKMGKLRDVLGLDENLTKAPLGVIRLLHNLVYGEVGDRGDRQRLREFTGFKFTENSGEFQTKVKWMIETLTLADLVAICVVLRLPYTGELEDIAKRICRHLTNFELFNAADQAEEEEEDEDLSEVYEEVQESTTPAAIPAGPRFTVSFRNVEDTVRTFKGSDGYPIETWVEDFEDNAKLFKWSEMQKLLFAKKSLKGLANLFVKGERGISSWTRLKSLLLEEF